MVISCFRGARGKQLVDDIDPPARRSTGHRSHNVFRRQGSNSSQLSSTSTCSNESISKLEPCKRVSDPEIDAMMMPLPYDPRPSRCLRLSHPKIYSNIVSDMKTSKGCRDWKNFAVFHDDDVDMARSADEWAAQKARQYRMRVRELEYLSASWTSSTPSSTPSSDRSIQVDMIG